MSAVKPLAKGTLGRLELRCPPFPQTLLEAVEMIDRIEEVEVRPVVRMVERDPILVAQLLRTVNSAYYGLQRAITSPERAVVLLGPVTVVGLVAGMSMLRLRPLVTTGTSEISGRIIGHSLATACFARRIVEQTPGHVAQRAFPVLTRSGAAYTAGLLHDLGKFILLYNYPDEAATLYREGGLGESVVTEDAREQERLLFGCDHTEAGLVAALHFQFPDALADVIRLHHAPEARRGEGVDPATACLLRATAAASAAASLADFGVVPGPAPDAEALLDDLVRRDLPPGTSLHGFVDGLLAEAPAVEQYIGALTQLDPEEAARLRSRVRLPR